MSFVPRAQSDIVAALLAYRTSDPDVSAGLLPTDLNVGTLERAHLESLALLMEESDQRVARAVLDAVSESCFTAFGFGFLPPQKAVGGEIFTALVAPGTTIPIPSGYQLIGPSGLTFETTADGAILAGQLSSAAVPIRCLKAGVVGNVNQDTIQRPVSPIAGIDLMTNPARTIGGFDTETSDARAIRFAAFLRTLVRGTKEALEFAALSASPQVVDARSVEPFLLDPRPDGVPFSGLVWLFVDDGTDSPSMDPGILAEVTKLVEGYVDAGSLAVPGFKAAGTRVDILKVLRAKTFIRAAVSLRPGGASRWTDIQAALTAAAGQYFDRLRIGEKVSYQSLVSFLSAADPDLAEVDLVFWLDGSTVPDYAAPISADDLQLYTPASPFSVGARGVLFSGSAAGPGSSVVAYPEWRLA